MSTRHLPAGRQNLQAVSVAKEQLPAAREESDDWEDRSYSHLEELAREESDDWESRSYSHLEELVGSGDTQVGRLVPSVRRPSLTRGVKRQSDDWGNSYNSVLDKGVWHDEGEGSRFGSGLEHEVMMDSQDAEHEDVEKGAPRPVHITPCHGNFISFKVNFGTDQFLVTSRYRQPIRYLARGAFGSVWSAYDSTLGIHVAIKKISNPFGDRVSALLALREVLLLRHMKHPNVMTLTDIVPPPSGVLFRDVYIVTELMDTDLNKLIHGAESIPEDKIQSFVHQLLCGLKYLHTSNILHRDLKPHNILVTAKGNLKICDLGQARRIPRNRKMSKRVGTLAYKAPEILLHSSVYTSAADMWSVGCILVECLLGKTLFKGANVENQLSSIFEVIGTPAPESDLSFLDRISQADVALVPSRPRKSLRDLIPSASGTALDLAERMLLFCPHQRIKIEDALKHPFLKNQHVGSTDQGVPPPPLLDFEDEGLTVEQVKDIIYKLSMELNPDHRGEIG